MKVDYLSNTSPSSSLGGLKTLAPEGDFQSALAQATAQSAAKSAGAIQAEKKAATKAERAESLAYLDDYMKKSPAEHMRDKVMKEMGITEEDLKNMPPEERAAKETEITRRIMERLLGKEDGDKAAKELEASMAQPAASSPGAANPHPASPAVIAALNAQLRGLTA